MICAQKAEKILPVSVVNEAVIEKVEEIEVKSERKVFRKGKLQLKEKVTLELAPLFRSFFGIFGGLQVKK